eukprot:CAMPEP_0113961274 /NCGR_PEP_ID=MMETSP0011_2-20120614/5214_1 /TAXON_ID=101924 /ORGANISM="Rhodosorus marinus" /LENGTH=358 /DNA_ID=CAMNT_0000972889 /DNA_START=174 /DNA_END=1250 /DNA_ORIENTATION=+ /assembly_acc=CAM_ASM_000156
MAGVTNYPFRKICREFGAPLCVSEMVLASGVSRPNAETSMKTSFGEDEHPRSIQLYGVDPSTLSEATKRLVDDGNVDHIDLNFGCPMKKVTSKGGGAAICVKPKLLARLVRSVASSSQGVPVTAKFREGIDASLSTFLDAGRACEAEGCAAVGLHARTAEMLYAGQADWSKIAELVNALSIPVLGNGDIFRGSDARKMMEQTGCAGVIVGRGCLGYPWLFKEIECSLKGHDVSLNPTLGEVREVILRHVQLALEWSSTWTEEKYLIRSLRKVIKWYLTGYIIPSEVMGQLMSADSFTELSAYLHKLDDRQCPPLQGDRKPRTVKKEFYQKVKIPASYLLTRDDDQLPGKDAEGDASCG